VDTVGADQNVRLSAGAVREVGFDPISTVHNIDETVIKMEPADRERTRQRVKHIGAVHLVMRKPERGLQRFGERSAQQRSPVVPAALVLCQGPHAGSRQLLAEAEPVQDARGVRADLNAGADLAQRRGPLVDVDVEAGLQQRERCAEAADASADDRDRSDGLVVAERAFQR
jgi:hypothetical protein